MKFAVHFSVLILCVASCDRHPTPQKWSFVDDLGVAVQKAGKTCLTIHNSSLSPQTSIRLIDAKPPQSELGRARIIAGGSCTDESGVDVGLHIYEIRLQSGKLPPSSPVVAVIGFSGSVVKEGELVKADLNGDKAEEFFQECTSSEGVHFTVSSDSGPDRHIKWHQYYYLGYDVSPTCSEKDMQGTEGRQ